MAQPRNRILLATLYSTVALIILVGTLTLIFTDSTYFHHDRRARGRFIMKGRVTVQATPAEAMADHSQKLKYYKKVLGVSGFTDQQVTHPILKSFITDGEKCQNCLPNYFIRATENDKSKYRGGTAVFLHHLKSGGTTIRTCLNKLLAMPYTWNGKTEKRALNQVFICDFSFNKRVIWKHLRNEKSRLSYHFLGGAAVMGICDDIDGMLQPCSYFTLLRDPIDRAVATYYYCIVRPGDELCTTNQLNATEANITQWVLHQRSYLFTQLTFDVRYCDRFSQEAERSMTCWYRQRVLMEQADVETTLKFLLEDMIDRFAVIGMLDHLEESLAMFEKVRVEKIYHFD